MTDAKSLYPCYARPSAGLTALAKVVKLSNQKPYNEEILIAKGMLIHKSYGCYHCKGTVNLNSKGDNVNLILPVY